MKKFTLRTFTQILTACVAIAALFCAIFGMLDYLRELTDRKKHYTESPRSMTITPTGMWIKFAK